MVQRALGKSCLADDPGAARGEMRFLHRVPLDAHILKLFGEYLLLELARSPQTIRGYHQQLEAVARMLGKQICEVTVHDIRYEVKRDESVALSTKQLRIAAFRQLHMWGLLEEESWANPAMLGVKSLPSPKRMPRPPISLLDARTLLSGCRTPNEYRTVYLGLYGGLRVSESASLDYGNVHGDKLTFIGKGDKERSVPIHPELRKVLAEFIHLKPRSKEVLMSSFAKMRDRLRVYDVEGNPATSHSLRRTAADFMYDRAEVPREVVKAILGHGSEVVDLYAPVRFHKMKQAIECIDYTVGQPYQMSLF